MALKYYAEYYDTENILHRFEIYDDNYNGVSIEVNGYVTLDYGGVNTSLECFRGSGLRINLEADNSLTFKEVFTQEERTFKVIYQRDSDTRFTGWINPEGYYESFVTDRWIVSIDCVDGLSYLKDLAYVEDDTGYQFLGKQSHLEVISNALLRTQLDLNINTNIDIYYDGLSTSLDILDNAFINTERFVKDDENTIMNCEEVLKDILEGYGACITQHNGEWFIYKPNQLYSDAEATFFRYDKDGVALSPTTTDEDFTQGLGSQVDGYYPHHVNGNQSISLDKAIGAYRINYKYGLDQSLLNNVYLQWSGSTIPDWTIDSTTNLTQPLSSIGVLLDFDTTTTRVLNLTSDNISVTSGIEYTVDIEFSVESGFSVPALPPDNVYGTFYYDIKVNSGATYYTYDSSTESWDSGNLTDNGSVDINNIGSSTELRIKLPSTPITGNLYFEIRTPEGVDNSPTYITNGEILLKKVRVTQETVTESVEGENHTLLSRVVVSNISTLSSKLFEVKHPIGT